ncbi:molybdenum cofactor cytidylyltransferase [Rhizobium leguminosarum]|uniref:Molybdenum cofactor cytidylyltransferase n=1 Tax=Rhizobium leguminosarum TaxID=384 RepID=A0AAE2MMB6_RHILE|nr:MULTISPECIES: NTP transferase domain-containing protein [Rhizobium]MBB4291789.1 molybdenum cofactor cytidylyltransferase [Rhizobium leguminosarum]MBB4298390.1 molybdenum cofactor cytidylyltransferase [Rhizobium leguminosarum]MBB4309528.1 molybdenum cofactor cytidylyltransferase [Rhizobium leguminosarum]MBB4418965.1 molybdenum cofactor cytidylyltransferase [Rhizobium leguminosarum]MBB4433704.1 molybdenum cofactor cytidylyltransferase [Rhizobium esperanzae]
MKFGEFPVAEAEGLVLAHSIKLPDGTLQKGQAVAVDDIVRLARAGIERIVAARIEDGDLSEDEAALRLAQAIRSDRLCFSEAATGRVNVYARARGLFIVNKEVVDRVNRVDPAITVACLADHSLVNAGDMVATFKIIPLAVPDSKVQAACAALRNGTAFEMKPFLEHAVSLIATELPSLKTSVMDKTAGILGRRLAAFGNRLFREKRVSHERHALAGAIKEVIAIEDKPPKLIIVFGASAVIDEADVIPEAIRRAGGQVLSVGMPVDPGNLMVLGRIGETYVVGAPGCARSPRENGFDWMLHRILAGEKPDSADVTGLGVGGLLSEIETRPRPRDGRERRYAEACVAIVLLAAGKASRMGESGAHKLLAQFGGLPLVRRSAMTALESDAASVAVVTGHRRAEIEAALSGLAITAVENPDYGSGMASSLIAGFSAKDARDADGVLVMLADMPFVSAADLNALIAAFRECEGRAIVRAVSRGKRGNPVILPHSLRAAIFRLEGDVGARHITETSGLPIIDVDIGDAAHLDVDTPEAVTAAGGLLRD